MNLRGPRAVCSKCRCQRVVSVKPALHPPMRFTFAQPSRQQPHATGKPRRAAPVPSLCPYTTLGVPITADDAEIKKAFRKLALQYHPDVSDSEDAHSTFIAIQQAYEVLSGKARGKDVPVTQSDWEWHDWYWNFCKSRNWSRNAAGKAPSDSTYRKPDVNSSQSKENLRTQLAGLRHRAAIRRQIRQHQSSPAPTPPAGAADSANPASADQQNMDERERVQERSEVEVDAAGDEGCSDRKSDMDGDDIGGEENRYNQHSGHRRVPPSADAKSRIMQQLAGLKRNAARAAQV